MGRVRSNVVRSFSDYLDDSISLNRPNSLKRAALDPVRSESKPKNRRYSRFSVLDERKERSMADPMLH